MFNGIMVINGLMGLQWFHEIMGNKWTSWDYSGGLMGL